MKKVYHKQCIKNEGGKPMEDIISKLAEIEAAASHIMEDVSEQKKNWHRNMTRPCVISTRL